MEFPTIPVPDIPALVHKTRLQILAGDKIDCLNWTDQSHVLLVIDKLVPETGADTTASRRRTFRALLDQEMAESGWQRSDQGKSRGYQRLVSPNQRPHFARRAD